MAPCIVLDQTHVHYSYKQQCGVSITVAENVDQNEWHLPTYDPRNENKYHYKLHSLDIYFWTQQDALQFVNGVRRVLPSTQVKVLDEPLPPHALSTSAVVQKLENVAISDPQYGASGSTQENALKKTTAGISSSATNGTLPPPPPLPANFAPMQYNPAAPAAPEAIKHREKTPPPDEDLLDPLAVAVAHDYQKQPFTPGYPPQSQFPLGLASPGLPHEGLGSPGAASGQFSPPPSQPGLQRAATMPQGTSLASRGLGSPYGTGHQQVPPPPEGPSPPLLNVNQPPVSALSNYTYGGQSTGQHAGQDYSIHQQLYRPGEHESAPKGAYTNKQEVRGRLEENAGRLERGVSGMLKKFEKKFG